MLSLLPVKKLSRQITSCPSPRRRSQRCDPTKPAPPVTNIRMLFYLSFETIKKLGTLPVLIAQVPIYTPFIKTSTLIPATSAASSKLIPLGKLGESKGDRLLYHIVPWSSSSTDS